MQVFYSWKGSLMGPVPHEDGEKWGRSPRKVGWRAGEGRIRDQRIRNQRIGD
jgi:hypothetical protein